MNSQSFFLSDCRSTVAAKAAPRVSSGSGFHIVSAHLVVRNCSPELLNEADHFLGIFSLVKEPRGFFLFGQSQRSLPNLFQGAKHGVRTG